MCSGKHVHMFIFHITYMGNYNIHVHHVNITYQMDPKKDGLIFSLEKWSLALH